jgi:hypothetical protein
MTGSATPIASMDAKSAAKKKGRPGGFGAVEN